MHQATSPPPGLTSKENRGSRVSMWFLLFVLQLSKHLLSSHGIRTHIGQGICRDERQSPTAKGLRAKSKSSEWGLTWWKAKIPTLKPNPALSPPSSQTLGNTLMPRAGCRSPCTQPELPHRALPEQSLCAEAGKGVPACYITPCIPAHFNSGQPPNARSVPTTCQALERSSHPKIYLKNYFP